MLNLLEALKGKLVLAQKYVSASGNYPEVSFVNPQYVHYVSFKNGTSLSKQADYFVRVKRQ